MNQKDWNGGKIKPSEIENGITDESVIFAEKLGTFLGTDYTEPGNNGRPSIKKEKLTTNQLRKFFGEVKRQQMKGYNKSDFVLLKPKLAYAVGRAQKNGKIIDFYNIIADAIDKVHDDNTFKNFIKVFEAIVAYHKAAEEKKNITNL